MNKQIFTFLLAAFLLPMTIIDAQYLDSYGGTTVKHFEDGEGQGFFRAKHDGEQWWLVTPDNNAYLSFGLNHFHSNLWAKDYNKSHWEDTFEGIAWSAGWKEGFYDHAKAITSAAGSNCLGYHNEDAIFMERERFLPYFKQYRPIKFSLHENPSEEDFVDVFSDEFALTCASVAQAEVLPYIDDPMIIGFVMSDVPIFTEGYAYAASGWKGYTIPTWARVLRNLPVDAPGKQQYVSCMRSEYDEDIAAFNSTYGSSFSNWDELLNAEDWRAEADASNSRETIDNNAFNRLCINKYYEVSSAAFRAVNPNHLFIGDKINANLNDLDELKLVVEEMKDYVDAIMFQCFAMPDYQQQVQDRIATSCDLPYMNGDGGFGAHGDPHMPNPQFPRAKDQAERAQWILDYASGAFKDPNFVGYHLCGVIDGWNTSGTNKPGVETALGVHHDVTLDALSGIGDNLYQYRGLSGEASSNVPDNLSDWGEYEDLKSEALERIDQYRKGDAKLQVLLPGDRPAANAELRAQLKRHDFLWGAVIRDAFFTSPHTETYKKNFLKYFNATGFGIELKPKWRGSTQEETAYELGMPWINANNIYMRGHALTWEGYSYWRPEDKAIYDDASLTDKEKGDSLLWSLGRHFHHAIPKWDVGCWDVTNESISNNDVNDLLPGYNTHAHWFRLADSVRQASGRDDIVLYANDYQVISAISSWAMKRPGLYRAKLDEQIAAGAPIEGIGFQSRLKAGIITPDSIYKRLRDFERYDLPYHATEFEIRDLDTYTYTDNQRRLLTEYMMIMYLSHKNVQGFWHWTFFDNNSNSNWDYSLFNYDGSPKINGIIWMDLMDGVFNTDVSLEASMTGEGFLRGYYGSYEFSATRGDSIFVGSFRIDSTSTEPETVVNMDRGFSLNGIENNGAYPLDQALNISVSAFSEQGDITAIGFFLDNDSIAGQTGADFDLSYTPTTQGWNEITLTGYDQAGNAFSHNFKVYFGDSLPQIEVLTQPEEPIIEGSTGNKISFQVSSDYAEVDSVIVTYAGEEYIHKSNDSPFVYSLDGLQAADYLFRIRVVDQAGGQAEESIPFSVIPDENILPEVAITSPPDSSIFNFGDEVTLTIESSDSDGSIVRVELFKDDLLLQRFPDTIYSTTTDTLGIGWHKFMARAMDDRGDRSYDSIYIRIDQLESAPGSYPLNNQFFIYPNPAQNTLYLSQDCDYAIYSLSGQKVLEGSCEESIDITSLQNGLYLIRSSRGTVKFRKN